MSKKGFDKFINKESGAKKKERIRQEKKQIRAEKNAWFDEQKRIAAEKRKQHAPRPAGGTASPVRPAKNTDTRPPQLTKPTTKTTPASRPPVTNKRSHPEADKGSLKPDVPRKRIRVPNSSQTASSPEPTFQAANLPEDAMPLNKFIAWSGVCGRREAADLVKSGKVTVNGKLITEPPFRVSQQDLIKVNGKKISLKKNLVYILLNKPKDYITTTDDPEGRKTVMDLIKNATPERVFPVGRLDRNTTGVLLLTNDGEVAQRLTHPKYEVKKIYEVKVDKPVSKQQLDIIASGVTLEDGFIQPDAVAYADTKDKTVIGIEIHSGRNRIVRRIFEHLGFDVKNLDRVMYGIFTKKNVDRGKWRFLSEKEIRLLKHLNTSFSNKKSKT